MIECVSLMCEVLAVLIVFNSFLGKKLVADVRTVIFQIMCVLILSLVNFNIIPVYMQALVYLLFVVYFKMEYSQEGIMNIIASALCTVFLLCGIQFPIFYILRILRLETYNGRMVNIVVLACVILLTKLFDFGKSYQYIIETRFGMGYIILGGGILSIILLLVLKLFGSFSILEMFLFDAIFLIVVIGSYQWKIQRDIIAMKEREVKWLAQCNESFEQLITDVRSRQHEFNSQIDAICGMQYSCTTYDELVQQIDMYTDKIIRENRFNRLLTMECPPIIKGFLYYRFCRAYEENIMIDYEIALDDKLDLSIVFDIAEIVGILFDNACDALKDKADSKHVFVRIKHVQMGIQILVENISPYIPYQQISLFMKKGYSTKDAMRGYGLYNVKNITKKYDGNTEICNIEKAGENWLQIMVSLPFSQ